MAWEFFHVSCLEKQSCGELKMVCAWPLPKGKLFEYESLRKIIYPQATWVGKKK